jgi:hypothetical protein
MRKIVGKSWIAGAFAVCAIIIGTVVRSAQFSGPSSSQSPYVLPSLPVVGTASILSVGDSVGGYRLAGIPDGLGAFDNGDGTFTLLMNHELGNTVGVVRAHGAKGAFVSKWIIDRATLSVVSASDLMQEVHLWDAITQQSFLFATPFAFNRFCSGDLPEPSAYFNAATGLGSQERIYMHGEEGGATGYQLGSVVTGADAGKTYVLGKFNLSSNGSRLQGVGAWENALASPYPQDKTIVIANSDGGSGIMTNAVAVYVGTKQTTGSEVDKAGLTNGTLKFVNVSGNPVEVVNTTTRATNIASGARFTLSGTTATTFSRPEDGAWNPLNPSQYYFVTTDQLDQVSDGVGAQVGQTRLWRLTFDDITNPNLGGRIDLLIDGRVVNGEKVNMFDSITVNERTGLVVLLEDVGNAAHNGKVWLYDPARDVLVRVARHDPARFGGVGVPATAPFNQDEETSGVIDVSSILGAGAYLVVDQTHYPINAANPRNFFNPDELAARLALDDKSLLKQWKPSYDAGYTMQASLAAASGAFALVAAWVTFDWRWIVGAVLILANWPYTVWGIMPTNHQLKAIAENDAGPNSRALLETLAARAPGPAPTTAEALFDRVGHRRWTVRELLDRAGIG